MSFYDLSAKDANGNTVDFHIFENKVVLIVNTASKCGFTKQFAGLQALYDEFKSEGLIILGFPCNQFMGQEPGSAQEAMQFCQLNYQVDFMMMEKVDVNGEHAHPVFVFLKEQAPFAGFDLLQEIGRFMHDHVLKIDKDYQKNNNIKWNFTKFLVSKDGTVLRFEPTVDPQEMKEKIRKSLSV
ncbi:glutathione peroxidase [Entomospira entomophila]|uniref:Glutathione peroxidase n=1 Tax=Entomospira entomophila TaxID=2719988 RepID=A0A968GAR3_9SPIO|nr:glutathione peroxidase [Entomospira entomophilus]NIZ41196.1 glutathione peroxidase [Entomospira entomophilus]WDI35402.1 glutathione peroxidase [Entomospira entomophilus]